MRSRHKRVVKTQKTLLCGGFTGRRVGQSTKSCGIESAEESKKKIGKAKRRRILQALPSGSRKRTWTRRPLEPQRHAYT